MDFDDIFNQLEGYIKNIEGKFIKAHIENELATPNDYDLDVKSYCILCHAALEEFIETISLQVMIKSINTYQRESKISKPIVSLMHFKGNYKNYLEKEYENLTLDKIETTFDYTRKKLDEVKSVFSKEILENHGVSLKYLRKLLMPVAIDIPRDINWSNSLEKLANERGAYAHKYLDKGRVRQSIEPKNASIIITDCLALCSEIKDRAKAAIA